VKVKMQELKQVCEMILTHLEQSGCDKIELEKDEYWTVISREDIYANGGVPKLGIGSLQEDQEGLEKILDGTNPITTNDFDRLGNIIIAIGENIDHAMKNY
jgi:hypothetical protein